MARSTRLYLPDPPAVGALVSLPPEQVRHARVLRVGPGARVELFDGEGGAWDAVVERAGRQELTLRVAERRADPGVESPLAITVLQGLARGARMEQVIRHGTELGVVRFVPVRCGRSTRQGGNVERWRAIAREGARQCGRARVPKVSEIVGLADLLRAPPGGTLIRLAGPGAAPLPDVLATSGDAMALLVGPEGGLDDAEARAADEAGFVPASLGPRVLRTETAALAAVAAIQVLRGDAASSG